MTTKPKKPARKDWHPADVKAALEKAGTNMRQLGMAHGYSQHYCGNAFKQGGHNVQTIIAEALGKKPWDIWPSRYDANNEPITRRKPFSYVRPENWTKPGCKTSTKDTAGSKNLNGNVTAS
jgi:Ner family transcriptional regulator